jgi:heme exporter protein D
MLEHFEWLAIVLTVIVLIILVQVLRLTRRDKVRPHAQAAADEPLSTRQLNEVEQACFQRLDEVAGREFNISNRVPLAQLLSDADKGQKINKSLSQQTIDFVLFNRVEKAAICAIQLQNPANSFLSSQRKMLEKAGIRVIQLPRKTSYSTVDIRKILLPFLNTPPPSADEMTATITMEAYRVCKRCNTPMKLKKAKSGKHKGTLFWRCGKYPECRYIELFMK